MKRGKEDKGEGEERGLIYWLDRNKKTEEENNQYRNYFLQIIKYPCRHQTKLNDKGVTFSGACHCCDICTKTLMTIFPWQERWQKYVNGLNFKEDCNWSAKMFHNNVTVNLFGLTRYRKAIISRTVFSRRTYDLLVNLGLIQSISFIIKLFDISSFLSDKFHSLERTYQEILFPNNQSFKNSAIKD